MKCKVFTGNPERAANVFNKYMHDKTLSKDVIIHTVGFPYSVVSNTRDICIVVIHPNWWDDPKRQPK